jgi:hypothetical protein
MTEKALDLHDASSRGAPFSFSEFVDTRPALSVLSGIVFIAVVIAGLGWSFEHFHLM